MQFVAVYTILPYVRVSPVPVPKHVLSEPYADGRFAVPGILHADQSTFSCSH